MEIAVYIVLGVIALAGVILTAFALPGIWLVFISVLIYGFIDKFTVITPGVLIVLFLLTLLATFIDNILVAVGAKKLGGSKWGMIGAIVGILIGGAIGNIPGMFIGSFVVATLFEFVIAKKDFKKSIKAGLGSFIGIVASIFIKVGIAVGMITYVLIRIL